MNATNANDLSTRTRDEERFSRIEALKNSGEAPARKAIALSWLIYLVADLHQPIHNTTLMTPRFMCTARREEERTQ